MDNKQLLDKFINGEFTEEQFEAERAKMTPEEQQVLDKDAEAAIPKGVERLKSVRRGIDKIASDKNQEQDTSLATKMRSENLDEARSIFFKNVGLTSPEEITAFEEGFKKHDSGSVTTKNIINDMEATYASMHKDDYLTMKREREQRERDAQEVIENQAGAGNGSGGAGGKVKISKEVENFIKDSAKIGRNLTPEAAQKALDIAKNRGRIA